MKVWQDSLGQFVATVTARMLLATGGMLITVGNSQVKVVTQIESITEKLQLLTENVGKLEERVRSLEIGRWPRNDVNEHHHVSCRVVFHWRNRCWRC